MKKLSIIIIFSILFCSTSLGNGTEVTELIKKLSDHDPNVRNQAAKALGNMGEKALPAIPHLIALINKERKLTSKEKDKLSKKIEYYVRYRSIEKIKEHQTFSTAFAETFPLRAEICRNAGIALGKIGEKAIPALLKNLKITTYGENHIPDDIAAIAFVEIGPKAIPALKENLYNSQLCFSISRILAEFGEPAVPILIESLSSQDNNIKKAGIVGLRIIGEKSAIALPNLIKLLSHPDIFIRVEAAKAIGAIGDKSESAIPFLIKNFLDPTYNDSRGHGPIYRYYHVSESAAKALEQIGEKSVPFLIETLFHPDERIKIRAAEALRKIGVKNEAYLEKIISEVDPLFRDIALKGLSVDRSTGQGIEELREIENWIHYLSFNDIETRRYAAERLGDMYIISTVTSLIKALLDEDQEVRTNAANSLAKRGRYILSYLKKALEDTKLLKVHPEIKLIIKHIISSLIQELLSEDKWTRKIAVKDLQTNGELALPYLKENLQNENLSKVHPQIIEIINFIEEKERQKK